LHDHSNKTSNGLEGDYIFRGRNNIIQKLSRTKKTDIYCTGIQVLDIKNINKKIKKTDDFNILWKELIKINQLRVSNIMPEKWFTVDNFE
jgi:MurNAc alpha-1-phosphate uridylyltransferase